MPVSRELSRLNRVNSGRFPLTLEDAILSEFYQLRRTAIKDLAAYLGFLSGFIGSAPFAWRLLAAQLEAGSFARGLWYFFGIVTTVGIFTGIAGLGLGHACGVLWEQFHRHRRRERLKRRGEPSSSTDDIAQLDVRPGADDPVENDPGDADPPRLQLVSPATVPFPNLVGRRLQSVRFLGYAIDLDFGGVIVGITGSPSVRCGPQLFRYPEAGSRDALCSLIGTRVSRMRPAAGDRMELSLDSGCELAIPRAGVAVA
jgi:hypothetical protein